MSATGMQVWSQTAATNATADSAVNWAEGMAPSAVNDSARAQMASAAKWRDDNNGTLATTGSSSAFTVTSNQVSTANADGYTLVVQFHSANDSAATLARDTAPAANLQVIAGTNVTGGEFAANSIQKFTYIAASTAWVAQGYPSGAWRGQSVTATSAISGVSVTATSAVTAQSVTASSAITGVSITASSGLSVAAAATFSTGITVSTGAITIPTTERQLLNPFGTQLLHVQDQKTANTDGGTFSSGAWRTRTLNTTLTNEISGASLTSNQITLTATGVYYLDASAPFTAVGTAKLRWTNVTDTSTAPNLVGQSVNDADTAGAMNTVSGRFTLTGTKAFELQHRATASQNTNGFGAAANVGEPEVYADVKVWRISN